MTRVGALLVVPGAVLVLVLGLWLVDLIGGFEGRVVASLALFAAAALSPSSRSWFGSRVAGP